MHPNCCREDHTEYRQMADSSLKKYPSEAVQQAARKIAFLIDCDGGLSSAFHAENNKPSLAKVFPRNSDIFLFYNSNNVQIVERMEDARKDNENVHLFPNIIANARNGADMNLCFMLGAINDKYDDYVIVTRYERAYEEIRKRLETTYPRLVNHVQIRYFKSPEELAQYALKLKEALDEDSNLSEPTSSLKSRPASSNPVVFTSENIFHHCPFESWQQSSILYRFKELLLHLDNQHSNVRYHYCQTCEELIQTNDSYRVRQQLHEHIRREHVENHAGFHLHIEL